MLKKKIDDGDLTEDDAKETVEDTVKFLVTFNESVKGSTSEAKPSGEGHVIPGDKDKVDPTKVKELSEDQIVLDDILED